MRISDWSSDVCSSDLGPEPAACLRNLWRSFEQGHQGILRCWFHEGDRCAGRFRRHAEPRDCTGCSQGFRHHRSWSMHLCGRSSARSEEHTSELQSLMRISYAVFCLKKKNTILT